MITPPVAKRLLSVAGNPDRSITVSVGQPEPDPQPGDNWRCSFHIDGINDAGPHFAYGVDSLQALLLAVEGVRKKLDESGLALTWLNDEPGNIGIPRTVPHFFGLAFARDIERHIDERIEAFGGAATGQASVE